MRQRAAGEGGVVALDGTKLKAKAALEAHRFYEQTEKEVATMLKVKAREKPEEARLSEAGRRRKREGAPRRKEARRSWKEGLSLPREGGADQPEAASPS